MVLYKRTTAVLGASNGVERSYDLTRAARAHDDSHSVRLSTRGVDMEIPVRLRYETRRVRVRTPHIPLHAELVLIRILDLGSALRALCGESVGGDGSGASCAASASNGCLDSSNTPRQTTVSLTLSLATDSTFSVFAKPGEAAWLAAPPAAAHKPALLQLRVSPSRSTTWDATDACHAWLRRAGVLMRHRFLVVHACFLVVHRCCPSSYADAANQQYCEE
ncbi:hypothetical protein C8J57DRAFT_1533484 [Mycena rebaudengoi]|nr:hypothetical protein C8J57DRAFT_1533484 [Mycena rebaudengoi]